MADVLRVSFLESKTVARFNCPGMQADLPTRRCAHRLLTDFRRMSWTSWTVTRRMRRYLRAALDHPPAIAPTTLLSGRTHFLFVLSHPLSARYRRATCPYSDIRSLGPELPPGPRMGLIGMGLTVTAAAVACLAAAVRPSPSLRPLSSAHLASTPKLLPLW